MGPILGSVDRRKLEMMKYQGWFIQMYPFMVLMMENPEVLVPGEGCPMVVLEGNGYVIKLGIYDGEVMGTTLGYVYGLKLGGR